MNNPTLFVSVYNPPGLIPLVGQLHLRCAMNYRDEVWTAMSNNAAHISKRLGHASYHTDRKIAEDLHQYT